MTVDRHEEDPTAWLGDPVGMHVTGAGMVVVSVPPAERHVVVISVVDAPTIDDRAREATAFVRVNLAGAKGLKKSLDAAIAQLEEHADS